jgi:hypothetical protein
MFGRGGCADGWGGGGGQPVKAHALHSQSDISQSLHRLLA